ncbi:MAG: DUF4062 domain-containing protein [Planctomycetes bacterium]|nr:DUF4062 domain-containing protein [Planctomycetota bacterium]
MVNDKNPAPASYKGVMVSSTFTDLARHRAELMKALRKEELFAIGMEEYVPVPGDDVISSSLNMVRKGSAYIGLISHRCGQAPECADRNPHAYSVTRLEFEEAQSLGLPTLIFIMGDDHPVKKQDVETDAEKMKKLEAFRKRAKEGRIYVIFDSLEDFTQQAIHAVARLRRYLDEQDKAPTPQPKGDSQSQPSEKSDPNLIPTPPAFYAEPPYIGSHDFVGRKAQLEILSDWASPADSHPVLLFEAIGGAGKSLLTWEWTTKHATAIRDDWAGIFWYSFYEKGAIMAHFCSHALAYMTGKPLKGFRKKKTPELAEQFLHQLEVRPWLVIFDGLERVLVAYHRFDAAQLTDEQAETPTDQIAHRDPCAAIRPEDDDLLRALAGAAPSKLLLTSRLIPRILLNPANQPIPGILRERLPGLRPADAEALLRSCGITGISKNIRNYLKTHCDCHPLVTGALAGLINNYLPDRGNFDAWAADPAGGGKLNLAELDLVQKRNHILHTALAALPKKSRRLLSTLALLSEAVDYDTLSALNPYLPPEPEEVEKPEKPEDDWDWDEMSDDEKKQARKDYQAAQQCRNEALQSWLESPECRDASGKLMETVRDLEHRGLLQYDSHARRYDLHPVVRGIAAGRLRKQEKQRYGQRVVDHFSQQVHSPYEQAETIEDLSDGLHVVRTLLQMGHLQEAFDAYEGDLATALSINLEVHVKTLSLLRPFFPKGWAILPKGLDVSDASYLANSAANALTCIGELEEAFASYSTCLVSDLREEDLSDLRVSLHNNSVVLRNENRLAKQERCICLELDLAAQRDEEEDLFVARLSRFDQLSEIGQWKEAEAMWHLLNPMGRDWYRGIYSPGNAEYSYAFFRFYQGDMTEEHIIHAEQLAREGKNRLIIRGLHILRGLWQLEQDRHAVAAGSFREAVRMARAIGQTDEVAEALLALVEFHLNELTNPREEAERLATYKDTDDQTLAELWFAIGDIEQAKKHALAAYMGAWADGEPYVCRYELNKARALLEQLGADIPDLPPYDPAKDEKLPWEDEVAAAIEKLRDEKEAKKKVKKKTKKKAKKKTK